MSSPPPPAWPPGGDFSSAAAAAADSDSDADDAAADAAQAAEEEAARNQVAEGLRKGFLALARASAPPAARAHALSDAAALATLTLGYAHVKQLLAAHMSSSSSGAGAVPDAATLESDLQALWSELPKTPQAGGAEGVTFAALLAALVGPSAADPTPVSSRRTSVSANAAGADDTSPRTDGAALSAHERVENVRAFFQPAAAARRHSQNAGSRSKRASESARAGGGASGAAAAAAALHGRQGSNSSGGAGQRARASTLFPRSHSPVSVPGSSQPARPHPSGALDLNDPDWHDLAWLVAAHPAAFSAAANTPRGSVADRAEAAGARSNTTTTLVSSSALQIAMQHYMARWLTAHELQTIASMWRFVRTGSSLQASGSAGAAGPASSPRPGQSPSAAGAAPSSSAADLLSFDVLSRAIAALRAALLAAPYDALADPLPPFARAMGLLPPAPAAGDDAAAAQQAQPSIDEVLEHLALWSTALPAKDNRALLSVAGCGAFLHHPAALGLLASLRSASSKAGRLEKELSLLISARDSLDSSHADLAQQVPALQAALGSAQGEVARLTAEGARASEAEAAAKAAKAAHAQAQKRLQALQEDQAALQNDLQHAKESLLASESELAAATASLAKTKERLGAAERELRATSERAAAKQAEDAASIAALSEQVREHRQAHVDLQEKNGILLRRLLAAGETGGLQGIAGLEDGLGDEAVVVGSLAINRQKDARREKAATHLGADLGADGASSLGAELDDVQRGEAMGTVRSQASEIRELKAQLKRAQDALAQSQRSGGGGGGGPDVHPGGSHSAPLAAGSVASDAGEEDEGAGKCCGLDWKALFKPSRSRR